MWRNYLTVSFRALAKNKVYAFINILGLAIGLAACLMIAARGFNERDGFGKHAPVAGADACHQRSLCVGTAAGLRGRAVHRPALTRAVCAAPRITLPALRASRGSRRALPSLPC